MLNKKSHHIESIIQKSALVYSYTLQKEQLSVYSGYVEAEVLFVNGYLVVPPMAGLALCPQAGIYFPRSFSAARTK
jgi:hypothetical protein